MAVGGRHPTRQAGDAPAYRTVRQPAEQAPFQSVSPTAERTSADRSNEAVRVHVSVGSTPPWRSPSRL